MYSVVFTKTAAKTIKKLPDNIKNSIRRAILDLQEDPTKWDLLTGIFRRYQIRSGHVTTAGGEYRFVYQIDEQKKLITVVYAGPREGFYKKLEKFVR